ncbi:hypothetical protein PISMIDRAFT_105800 [Pisolithus microcarpus 441]|uniref:HAT C-terminal dimerisation domain-containing protein n=1 Tax=Pisolithus microcarpus 441 TaxID=765257 RepID=A0A0C9ZKL0_9AGAM|nr:hypothetical protein PISMIDRAFT_105800 [Pisolithus microcarpus 441]
MYPHLSHMALDYLSIPAMSVGVECTFSQGHVLLSHVCNCLSAQTTCSLLCLSQWSSLDLIANKDLESVTLLLEVNGDEVEMAEGWDNIL